MTPVHDDITIAGFFGEYRWLSNFWYAPMLYGTSSYPTNEHFYQAMKSMDLDYRYMVRTAKSPGEAKRLGSAAGMKRSGVTLREDWEDMKDEVMRYGLYLKFSQNPMLGQKLIDTGDRLLAELNTWGDTYWGVTGDTQAQWFGGNVLGKLLMCVRTGIREGLPYAHYPRMMTA